MSSGRGIHRREILGHEAEKRWKRRKRKVVIGKQKQNRKDEVMTKRQKEE